MLPRIPTFCDFCPYLEEILPRNNHKQLVQILYGFAIPYIERREKIIVYIGI
jgi:hypothetical protein